VGAPLHAKLCSYARSGMQGRAAPAGQVQLELAIDRDGELLIARPTARADRALPAHPRSSSGSAAAPLFLRHVLNTDFI
jgi:hypothetical protein